MNGLTFWMPSLLLTACLGLSALSLGFALSSRRKAAAKARRVAAIVARKEINGYWRALDRQILELHGRLDGMGGPASRPTIRIARTGEGPRDAA